MILLAAFVAGCGGSRAVVQNGVNDRRLPEVSAEDDRRSQVEPRLDVQTGPELTSCTSYRVNGLPAGSWEDAYTLSRRSVEEGTSTLVVGRIATMERTRIFLDTVCRSSDAQLRVAVKTMPCGVVGDIVLVRATTAKPDLLYSLSVSDGPTVWLAEADVLGGVFIQDVCKGEMR